MRLLKLNAQQLRNLQQISGMIAKGESSSAVNHWEIFLKNSINDFRRLKPEEANIAVDEIINNVVIDARKEINTNHLSTKRSIEDKLETVGDGAQLANVDQQNALQKQRQSIEDKLTTVGDDAQLASVDQQNALQKQQQTLQMLSTISKLLYDTSMSVIRKMGG